MCHYDVQLYVNTVEHQVCEPAATTMTGDFLYYNRALSIVLGYTNTSALFQLAEVVSRPLVFQEVFEPLMQRHSLLPL